MAICPLCQTDLGDSTIASGRCPTCGNVLVWNEEPAPSGPAQQVMSPPPSDRPKLASWSPPSTNDPVALLKATIARIATRDVDPDKPKKSMSPLLPPTTGNRTVEMPVAPAASLPPVAPQAMPPLSSSQRTMELTPPPGMFSGVTPPAKRDSDEFRKNRGSHSATVDLGVTPPTLPPIPPVEGADPSAAAPPTKKTKSDAFAATVTPDSLSGFDSPGSPDASTPGKKPSTFDDKRFAATYDSGNFAPEDTERVAKLWRGTVADSATPRTSLKQDIGGRAKDSRLVIKKRALKQAEAGVKHVGADYELLNLIGEGGMGVVYAARQASIDRTVAVKMLKPDMASHAEQREKFLSEAVVTGDLDHPNIVPIYDLGSSEAGALFYSMKRVQGTPWMNVLPEKSLPENVEILMKVADAVAFAHSRGVIHRDLKPENVMLGDYGEVLVMDWGLAMSTATFRKAESITQTSSMGGTPAYMAPEMATGPVDRITPISDVYLLGAILFEILTGKPPHTGKNVMNCLFAAAKNEIQACEQSGELLDVAMQAMATKTEDRHQTVQDFQNAIRQYQSHSESIVLSSRAEEDLARAEKSGDYQTFSRALFGFQEAFALWDGNSKAKAGVSTAKLAYATQALKKEDFDLGLSLLDAEDPSHAELRAKLQAAQQERDSRQLRLRTLRRGIVAAVAMMLIVVTVAFFKVLNDQQRAVAAEKDATNQMHIAQTAEGRAKEAEKTAKSDRDIAVNEKDKADKAKAAAIKAQQQAEEQRKRADDQAKIARKEEQRAIDAKKKADYEGYIARIGLAAAKIDENAFDTAESLLDQCRKDTPELCDWEWHRLRYLSTQSVRTFTAVEKMAARPRMMRVALKVEKDADGKAKTPAASEDEVQAADPAAPAATAAKAAYIEAIAFSHDGALFVSGSWDGMVRVWDVGTGRLVNQIPYGGKFVQTVAFSPDGKWIAVGGSDKAGQLKLFDAKSGALVRTFKGHTDDVLSVVFSKDGSRLLTASYDRTARLWNTATGDEVQRYLGHNWWVWSADFSPDEKKVVTASQDGTVIVWETASGKAGEPFRGHVGPVYSAEFSPDGQSVVSGGYDNQVLIWKPSDIKPFDYVSVAGGGQSPPPVFRALEGHTAPIRAVAFSPNGKMVLSAGHDNTVKLWDVERGKLVKSLRGHAGWVRSAQFSPDGHFVLSGSHDGTAKLWSIAAYEEIRVFQGRILQGHADAVLSAQFSDDGKRIVTASRDRTAKSWDTTTGKSLRDFEEGHDYLASTAMYFPDGKRLLTAAADNTARIWDITTGTQSLRLDHTGRGSVATLSHNGKWVLTGSDDKSAKIWNAETGALIKTTKPMEDEVSAVAFSADDRYFVTGDTGGACVLWDTATAEQVRSSNAHTGKIMALAFTPGDKRVLTASTDHTVGQWDVASGDEPTSLVLQPGNSITSMAVVPNSSLAVLLTDDHRVALWDIDRARIVKTLADGGSPSQVAASADGRYVLWTNSVVKSVRLFDLKAGRELASPGDKTGQAAFLTLSGQLWAAAFSPDNGSLVTVGGNGARVWDMTTATERMSLSPNGVVASANFSPKGVHVVTGSWDNSAKIWTAETAVPERKLLGHSGYVNSACYSPPDGATVLTASDDHTAKVWDAKTGVCLHTLTGHADRVTAAVYSADGSLILTGSADKTARLWDAKTFAPLGELHGVSGVLAVAFSNDSQRVITGHSDNTAIVWDVKTHQPLLELAGHTAGVDSVAISPDGRRAMTGSQDNSAKVWDVATIPDAGAKEETADDPAQPAAKPAAAAAPGAIPHAKEILTLKAHSQEVTSVAFSPDGHSVLTASRDGTAILWLTSEWDEEKKP